MVNELIEIFAAYAEESDNDIPRKEIVDPLRNKLMSQVTPENINESIDRWKNTLLHKAVYYQDTILLRRLLELNAKLDAKNKIEDTPMRIATTHLYTECIELLYKAGGNIDDIDYEGRTGLYHAVRTGKKEKVKGLLKFNANVHAVDNEGQTILDSALLLLQDEISADIKFEILRLLFENYIGIGTDLTGIDLPPGVVDGLLVIFATKDGQPITNKTQGFEKAICSVDELLQSKILNFKKLQYILEKVFRPYFPGKELVPLYEHRIYVYSQFGKIRQNNFETAGPELEKLYKTLRIRTAGVSSLRELASTALMIKHGLKAEKTLQPDADVKSTPSTEAQQLTEKENSNQAVQPSEAALLIKQGLHAEKMQQPDATLDSSTGSQNLSNPSVHASENMKLVANVILDPEKLALMPTDIVEYIEKLGADLADKLPSEISKRSTNKGDPT